MPATGIAFRGTADFVTDAASDTYCLGDIYPTTRGGLTFGWDTAGALDRDSALDPRLAGINYVQNSSAQITFRVDLAGGGPYDLRLSLGDITFNWAYQYIQFKDDTTPFATIDDTNGLVGQAVDDATFTERTASNWGATNRAINHIFASPTLRLVLGAPGFSQPDYSTLGYISFVETAAPPTYFGSASNPTDNGTGAEPATLAVTPPVNMVAGDLVVFVGHVQVAAPSSAMAISATGGQTWSVVSIFTGANDEAVAVFWCQYNGTWSADPSIIFAAESGTQPCTAVMHVFRPAVVDTWAVDTVIAGGAEASTSPVVITGITPSHPVNVTLAGWLIPNISTWGTLSGTEWVVTGTAQYRNSSGTDQSATFAHQLQATAAATGDVSKVPSTAAAGVSWIMAWYVTRGINKRLFARQAVNRAATF